MSSLSLTGLATGLVGSLGYGGLAVGMLVNSAGVPIPSEVLLPISGALINTGRFQFWPVVLIGIAAQTLGAVASYWIGATGGIAVVKKYGKYVLFSERELGITQKYFARYGEWLALVGRCIPVVCTYIGYPAGLAKMKFSRFLTASIVGATIWTLVLTELGVKLATPERLASLDKLFHRFSLVVVALLVLGVIWYVKRHLKGAKSQ